MVLYWYCIGHSLGNIAHPCSECRRASEAVGVAEMRVRHSRTSVTQQTYPNDFDYFWCGSAPWELFNDDSKKKKTAKTP